MDTIRNPIEWGADKVKGVTRYLAAVGRSLRGTKPTERVVQLNVRQIRIAELRDVLAQGFDDFKAFRTDVVFVCFIYPVIGLVLARFAFDYSLLPLLFPIASGFALLGPVAAVGLYEMSRRREKGLEVNWAQAFATLRSPSFGAIAVLGLVLLVIFLLWLVAAQLIYWLTLGPEPPSSATAFLHDVFTTREGWAMIIVGFGIGFLFALLVLAISVVSFPLMLDLDIGLGPAVAISVRVVRTNPLPMVVWGLIVAGGLVLGSIPFFVGLIIVLPVLGHSTWHLYRTVCFARWWQDDAA